MPHAQKHIRSMALKPYDLSIQSNSAPSIKQPDAAALTRHCSFIKPRRVWTGASDWGLKWGLSPQGPHVKRTHKDTRINTNGCWEGLIENLYVQDPDCCATPLCVDADEGGVARFEIFRTKGMCGV